MEEERGKCETEGSEKKKYFTTLVMSSPHKTTRIYSPHPWGGPSAIKKEAVN